MTVPFRLILFSPEGFITSSQLYPSEAEANKARVSAALLPGEVIKSEPEPQAHRTHRLIDAPVDPETDRAYRAERRLTAVDVERATHGYPPTDKDR